MSRTHVVNRSQTDDWDVYVGRPSRWGNPFAIGPDGTREDVIRKYREWLEQPEQWHLRNDLVHLRGKVLACWCAPEPCHAEILAELADGRLPSEP